MQTSKAQCAWSRTGNLILVAASISPQQLDSIRQLMSKTFLIDNPGIPLWYQLQQGPMAPVLGHSSNGFKQRNDRNGGRLIESRTVKHFATTGISDVTIA